MFRTRANALIECFDMREGAGSQARSKGAGCILDVRFAQFRPVRANYVLGGRTGNISRKEHLQGAFTRLTSRTHNNSGIKKRGEMMKLLGKGPQSHPLSFILHPS
jgi:hypothetical protein